jgi:hypothetical protein
MPALVLLAQRAAENCREARASNTLRAYASDWAHFSFVVRRPVPCFASRAETETIILYLTELSASAKASTLARLVATNLGSSVAYRSAIRLFLRACGARKSKKAL